MRLAKANPVLRKISKSIRFTLLESTILGQISGDMQKDLLIEINIYDEWCEIRSKKEILNIVFHEIAHLLDPFYKRKTYESEYFATTVANIISGYNRRFNPKYWQTYKLYKSTKLINKEIKDKAEMFIKMNQLFFDQAFAWAENRIKSI